VNTRIHSPKLEFYFDGKSNSFFEERFRKYLDQISAYMPFIRHLEMNIQTQSTFPHSSGIASSASSFGAFALALCSTEQLIFGTLSDESTFFTKASFLARLGSGSAARSIYGGYAVWGHTRFLENSTDETAIPINVLVHPVFQHYYDSILIIDPGKKEVSSSEGHNLMNNHPYKLSRVYQANENTGKLLAILTGGDEESFVNVVEEEALSLHALMFSSHPGYILLRPNTLEAIERIRFFRKQTGLPVCFTLDAGANIHVLYPGKILNQIRSFIESELKSFCDRERIIHDSIGNGPHKLS
jgi:diphosphomevalonate decarboxylase